jgi:hypothetical protein
MQQCLVIRCETRAKASNRKVTYKGTMKMLIEEFWRWGYLNVVLTNGVQMPPRQQNTTVDDGMVSNSDKNKVSTK